MTPPSDELRNLWNLDPGGGPRGAADLLREIEKTASRLERTIRFRDLRETAGGLLVAVLFGWLAIRDAGGLERAAHVWLAACGVWIVFYIRRYSKVARRPVPDRTLLDYQHELVARYDQQIRLLKGAKYWYILPFWVGLSLSAVAELLRSGNALSFGVRLFFITAFNGGLWWLNERVAVGYLQNERRQMMVRSGMEGVTE